MVRPLGDQPTRCIARQGKAIPNQSPENWRYRKIETMKTLLKPVDDSLIYDESDRTKVMGTL